MAVASGISSARPSSSRPLHKLSSARLCNKLNSSVRFDTMTSRQSRDDRLVISRKTDVVLLEHHPHELRVTMLASFDQSAVSWHIAFIQ
jgi:hypothetical protein